MADKTDEEKEQTAIAVRTNLEMTPTGLVLTNLDEMYRFAQYVSASPFAPKDMRDPVSIVVAIQYGAELGLSMMAALANIAVINGKPSVYGDVMLALVRASGLLEDFSEGLVVKLADGKLACQCAKWAREGECIHSRAAVIPFSRPGEERVGVCFAKRKGTNEGNLRTFGVVDAKIGSLWGKSGPWTTAPDRMLMFRPRGFVLRDEFGDVLKGLISREEAMDMQDLTPTPKKLTTTLKDRLKSAPSPTLAEEEADVIDAEEEEWEADPDATPEATVEPEIKRTVREPEPEPEPEAEKKEEMKPASGELTKAGLELIKKGLARLTPVQRDEFFEAFQISKVSALKQDQWTVAAIWIDKRTIHDEKDDENAPIVQQEENVVDTDFGNPFDDEPAAGEVITDEQVAELAEFAEAKGLTGEQLDVVRGWLEVPGIPDLSPALLDRARKLIAIIAHLGDAGRMQTALKHYGAATVLALTDEHLNQMLAKLAGGKKK